MGKKILCINFYNDLVQYVELTRQHSGYFPNTTAMATSNEALLSACNRAEEIYINSSFQTAIYERGTFPKLSRRNLENLVRREAREKHGSAAELDIRIRIVGNIEEGGVTKTQVDYVAVEKQEVDAIRARLAGQFKKVRHLGALPVSLASTVRQLDHPSKNFLLIFVGIDSSAISINSPEGDVRLARLVPLGLPRNLPEQKHAPAVSQKEQAVPEDALDGQMSLDLAMEVEGAELPSPAASESSPDRTSGPVADFTRELDRELSMTNTFFKQKFREGLPGHIYLLGHAALEKVIGQHPLASAEDMECHYGFSKPMVQGLAPKDAQENIHLFSSLYASDDFNFLPRQEVAERKAGLALNLAVGVMALLLGVCGFWSVQLTNKVSASKAAYEVQVAEKAKLEQSTADLREALKKLEPIKERKQFYDATFLSQPSWKALFHNLTAIVPEHVVINSLKLSLVDEKNAKKGKGKTGTKPNAWKGQLTGEIRGADNWEDGLKLLREFGSGVHAADMFDVANVDYTLGGMDATTKAYTFKMDIEVFSGE